MFLLQALGLLLFFDISSGFPNSGIPPDSQGDQTGLPSSDLQSEQNTTDNVDNIFGPSSGCGFTVQNFKLINLWDDHDMKLLEYFEETCARVDRNNAKLQSSHVLKRRASPVTSRPQPTMTLSTITLDSSNPYLKNQKLHNANNRAVFASNVEITGKFVMTSPTIYLAFDTIAAHGQSSGLGAPLTSSIIPVPTSFVARDRGKKFLKPKTETKAASSHRIRIPYQDQPSPQAKDQIPPFQNQTSSQPRKQGPPFQNQDSSKHSEPREVGEESSHVNRMTGEVEGAISSNPVPGRKSPLSFSEINNVVGRKSSTQCLAHEKNLLTSISSKGCNDGFLVSAPITTFLNELPDPLYGLDLAATLVKYHSQKSIELGCADKGIPLYRTFYDQLNRKEQKAGGNATDANTPAKVEEPEFRMCYCYNTDCAECQYVKYHIDSVDLDLWRAVTDQRPGWKECEIENTPIGSRIPHILRPVGIEMLDAPKFPNPDGNLENNHPPAEQGNPVQSGNPAAPVGPATTADPVASLDPETTSNPETPLNPWTPEKPRETVNPAGVGGSVVEVFVPTAVGPYPWDQFPSESETEENHKHEPLDFGLAALIPLETDKATILRNEHGNDRIVILGSSTSTAYGSEFTITGHRISIGADDAVVVDGSKTYSFQSASPTAGSMSTRLKEATPSGNTTNNAKATGPSTVASSTSAAKNSSARRQLVKISYTLWEFLGVLALVNILV